MDSGLISTRYTKALLSYAEEKGQSEDVYNIMSTLADNFSTHSTLNAVLQNPTLDTGKKRALIKAASGEKANEIYDQFINLLLENKRESQLQCIALTFCDFYRKKANIYQGKLTTAVPIDKKSEDLIRNMMKEKENKSLELKTFVDDKILGGFILDIEGERLDASIANQLRQIGRRLIK